MRRRRESLAGWLFTTPALVLLGLFLLAPILLAVWVSLLDWDGTRNPLAGGVPFVGLDNYRDLLTQDGLLRTDFATSVRNTLYFVLLAVPAQTALAFGLAVAVNNKLLRGRTFFRTVFYFPSVTSSVAISVVFLFLFSGTGAVNGLLRLFGVDGPTWFADPRGLLHLLLGQPPRWMLDTRVFSLSLWDWVSGPSVAMTAVIVLVVWTTSGTFMLMYLAALQNLPEDVGEAALIDGATRWQRLRGVTLPLLRPTTFLVMTLGLISTWQVFDQVYVMSQGNPAKTTLTPAYLSYQRAFGDGAFGTGAAIAITLTALILVLTWAQRRLFGEGRG
ncbi:carbohydrate ABC transporter permease [Kutzneria albida]|uniref:ABC transmembrane type-1 domain-containing protein n=1 Tax=Kutzneria albida DSM 43870 TaxID=1449976 RepID=W5WE23_9PSEU|nr:sugar ABC transporter permease [Kutzneria albida]AHH99433.1 hypothetical protein KALB_6073 [Kutzneria albida DSM 43870]